MIFRLACDCGASGRADVSWCPEWLSPAALALSAAHRSGWRYAGGRLGKSVLSVLCRRCAPGPLRLEGDVLPAEAVPTDP